jgi:hypothetical protein
MDVTALIVRAAQTDGCRVRPPSAGPDVPGLPGDLSTFYTVCGGVDLFPDADFAVSLVAPDDLRPTNVVMFGEPFADDRSATWYTIGRTPDGEYLSIDLSAARNGRCYDSFHEIHGVAGSCPVIARSFTDLFRGLLDARGGHWFWLEPGFVDLGDAYDD